MTPSCPTCSTILPSTNQCCDDTFTCADVRLRAVYLPLGSKHWGARTPVWFCSLLNPQWQSCAWHSVGAHQQTLVEWMSEHAHHPHKKIISSTFAFCRRRSWAVPSSLHIPSQHTQGNAAIRGLSWSSCQTSKGMKAVWATALISIPSQQGRA